MTTPQPAALPELPKPAHRGPTGTGTYFDSYTADQMRAYAIAALQSQPAAAGVSDAEIKRVCDQHGISPRSYVLAFARAILALRPQAVPMTEADLLACVVKANCLGGVPMSNRNGHYHIDTPSDAVVRLKDAIEAHHDITAQGAQGVQG